MSALRYIKNTTTSNTCVVLVTLNLQVRPCCPSGPTVQTSMRFLVFLHTVHTNVIFCWFPSYMKTIAESAVKAALQKKCFRVFNHIHYCV